MHANSTIRLDRDALDENLQLIRSVLDPKTAFCAVVKADAYGVGAERIVPRMVEQGVDLLAVYSLAEAAEIGVFSGSTPILVLMPVREIDRGAATLGLLARNRLHLVAHSEDQVACLEDEVAVFGNLLHLHLELDTGMGRGGCDLKEASKVLKQIAANPRLRLAGVMTHLPDPVGDPDMARRQKDQLAEFVAAHRELIPAECAIHAAASAGVISDDSLRMDMVRLGLAWTGLVDHLPSSASRGIELRDGLRPVLSWWSDIIHLRQIPKGQSVGYGTGWQAPRDSLIGVVPAGYAHGFPMPLRGSSHRVVVHGCSGPVSVPVVGPVNMDQITLDLTNAGPVVPGDAVELISSDPHSPAHLLRLADRAGLKPHAVLAGLNQRIPRVMVAGHTQAEQNSENMPMESMRIAKGG